MVRTRYRIYSTYVLILDKLLLCHDIFIRRKSLGGELADSIIASNKGISIDPTYDEMISKMLDEFPILGWRKCLLTCLNDEIVDKKNSSVINTMSPCRDLYYYGLSGEVHDQDLFSTQFSNTRGMFLTNFLRSVIERSDTYFPINIIRAHS